MRGRNQGIVSLSTPAMMTSRPDKTDVSHASARMIRLNEKKIDGPD